MSEFGSAIDQAIVLEAIRECGSGAPDFEVAKQAVGIKAKLAKCLDRRGVVSRALGANALRGILEDCVFKDASQRYAIRFRPLTSASDVETVVTDRRDRSPHVDGMVARLTLGEGILVYKGGGKASEDGTYDVAALVLPMPLPRGQ